MKIQQTKAKKPLYFGDPNATLTICYKKRRRHLPSDFGYKIEPAEGDKPVEISVFCRHCKEDPAIHPKVVRTAY
jgi:hypothetical protein